MTRAFAGPRARSGWAWTFFIVTAPLLGLSRLGALVLVGEWFFLRGGRGRPDEAPAGRGEGWFVRAGVAAHLLFAVAWLALGERSPAAGVLSALASTAHTTTPEIVRTALWNASRAIELGALGACLVSVAVRLLVGAFPRHTRALTRVVIAASMVGACALSARETVSDLGWLVFPPPPPPWEQAPLAPLTGVVPHDHRAVRYPRVFLVLMESVGAQAVAELTAEDGPMRRIGLRAARYDSTLAPSNASFLSQSAVLTSHDFTQSHRPEYHLSIPRQPLLGAAAWFHARGHRTVMVSSQDERWLGMDRAVAAQPWDVCVHSVNTAEADRLYRDPCGVTKVLDTTTVARFTREVDASPGPVFGYLNLQDTHYPYVLESGAHPEDFAGFTCEDFMSMPEGRLAEVRRRRSQALRDSAARVERLMARYPDALFVLTGDHGEEMVAGPMFGHAKSLMPAQFETFMWFIGPGVAPGPRAPRASLLDTLPSLIELVSPGELAALPPAVFQGHSVWSGVDPARRVFFAVSSGAHAEQTAVRGDLQFRVVAGEGRCAHWNSPDRPVPLAECRGLQAPLSQWLSCQVAFGSGVSPASRRSFNPCHAMFEGLGWSGFRPDAQRATAARP